MTYPRALALAEVVWSPREARSWEGFSRRLPARLRELDALGVGYRIPSVEGLETDRLTLADSAVVTLGVPLDRARIRYTLDGSDPDARAPLYTGPLTLRLAGGPVTVTARAELPGGRTSAPRAATFSRTTLREPAAVSPTELTPGLRSAYYEAQLSTTAALDTLAPVREGVATGVGLTGTERPENFGLRLTGYLSVPRDGIYTFTLGSDDGSTLAIGDRVVVDHDGFHGDESRSGMVALRAGLHPVTVRYFQGGGGKALRLTYRLEGGEAGPVPAGWLFHQR